jgi:hypothetical protein
LIQKYEREVIITAKVGIGPGELGVIGEGPIPEAEALWDVTMEGPKGIAVDSMGNIYILDNLNRRVVKFSDEGKYIAHVILIDIEKYQEGLENHLFVDDENHMYIKTRTVRFGEPNLCKYIYDKEGGLLKTDTEMPKSLQNMENKIIACDINRYTTLGATLDTAIHYFITDSSVGTICTLTVPLTAREGWEYSIGPHSFLGFDKNGIAYIHIALWEYIPAWLPVNTGGISRRKEEHIIFGYKKEGAVISVIVAQSPGMGYEIWTIGGDGALYLMKYGFKTVITDELPEWLKDQDIPEEAKERWRRRYTAPEGHVYVIKYTRVEEE